MIAICKIVANTTTPIPSLNNDSPVILVSMDVGMPAFFKMPSTAIGSVGEIKAPNNRHPMYGRLKPNR